MMQCEILIYFDVVKPNELCYTHFLLHLLEGIIESLIIVISRKTIFWGLCFCTEEPSCFGAWARMLKVSDFQPFCRLGTHCAELRYNYQILNL